MLSFVGVHPGHGSAKFSFGADLHTRKWLIMKDHRFVSFLPVGTHVALLPGLGK
jgi:hypothetical protein